MGGGMTKIQGRRAREAALRWAVAELIRPD